MDIYLGLLLKIPLVMSWHTSLHEYAGRRLERLTEFLGDGTSQAIGTIAEGLSLQVLRAFYRQASLVMAPNHELIDLTRALTGKPVFLMKRGVDAVLFHPAKRKRLNEAFRVGYVGRLTPEKNVRFLAQMGQHLNAQGIRNFEILIVGEGNESNWLRSNVPNATLTGVLRGEELAAAYAGMDLFAFPSTTETYGKGHSGSHGVGRALRGDKQRWTEFLIRDADAGMVAQSDSDFVNAVQLIVESPSLHQRMRLAARDNAMTQSWDAVFESVYQGLLSLCSDCLHCLDHNAAISYAARAHL